MAEQQQAADQNLTDSIAMLEQILEVMPQDADALKALYSAYRKVGQERKAFEYLCLMIDVFEGGGEPTLRGYIHGELQHFEESFPSEVAAHVARLRMGDHEDSPAGETKSAPVQEPPRASTSKHELDISEELSLAWRLYEENQLSQEEYSSVLHDLTEVSSKDVEVPVSVLHVLNDRGFTQMNRVMNYLSSRSGVPCIVLSNFQLSEDVANVLPLQISVHDGALPFAFLGDDVLVAVLNPFNNSLVDRIESECGHHCHTYLVGPEDYDMALGKLKNLAGRINSPAQG
jgi:hypothetical protein